MNNTNKRVVYMSQYSTISQQQGKLDALYERILDEPNIDKAIKLARAMRGHVAVTLKALHSIKRGEKPLEWLRSSLTERQEKILEKVERGALIIEKANGKRYIEVEGQGRNSVHPSTFDAIKDRLVQRGERFGQKIWRAKEEDNPPPLDPAIEEGIRASLGRPDSLGEAVQNEESVRAALENYRQQRDE